MAIFPIPLFIKQILHLKLPIILLLFTGSLFSEITKAHSHFKKYIVTKRSCKGIIDRKDGACRITERGYR